MKRLLKVEDEANLYDSRLYGFRATHRNRWLLVRNKHISLYAFLLFEFYLDIMDFDPNHKAFGFFQLDFVEIAKIFKRSTSTIRSWHNELRTASLVSETSSRNFYEVLNPERYILQAVKGSMNATNYTKHERKTGEFFQNIVFTVQNTEKKRSVLAKDHNSKALGSSKVESIKDDEYILRDSSEYSSIANEGKFDKLTEEDFKLIDQSLFESSKITPK